MPAHSAIVDYMTVDDNTQPMVTLARNGMPREIVGKITRTERSGTSYYGNPEFKVAIETEDGTVYVVKTKKDSMLAYGITNPEYRDETWRFHLDGWGKLTRATFPEQD